MSKLLSANFARMKKSKVFWVCLLFMIGLGIFMVAGSYISAKEYGGDAFIENTLLTYTTIIGMVIAVFCSLFVGTEYNDGTIRNKLIVGHTRVNVYLANLITCCTASVIFTLGYIAVHLALGLPLLGGFTIGLDTVALNVLTSLATGIAMASIFTTIAMLNQNRAVVAVVCLVGFLVMLFAASYIQAKLSQPEMWEAYSYTEEDDMGNTTIIEVPAEPNPMYPRGISRDIYEFLNDFIPTCQEFQYLGYGAYNLWQFALYSGIITLFCGALGIVLFKRKNLK